MKFTNIKTLKQGASNLLEVIRYLSVELVGSMRDLIGGLEKLSFDENFESFQATVTIASSGSATIRNQLQKGYIPTRRLIIKEEATSAGAQIVDGVWDVDFIRLNNIGSASTTVTVEFFR